MACVNSRIKPDVVATGVAYSAKSLSKWDCGSFCDNHDGVTIMGGTSMATPAVAGASAIITQYFHEGNYHGSACGEGV